MPWRRSCLESLNAPTPRALDSRPAPLSGTQHPGSFMRAARRDAAVWAFGRLGVCDGGGLGAGLCGLSREVGAVEVGSGRVVQEQEREEEQEQEEGGLGALRERWRSCTVALGEGGGGLSRLSFGRWVANYCV